MICSLAVPEGLRAGGRMYSDDFPNGGYPSCVASRRHDNAFLPLGPGDIGAMFLIVLRAFTVYRMWRRLPPRQRAALRRRVTALTRQLVTATAGQRTALRESITRR